MLAAIALAAAGQVALVPGRAPDEAIRSAQTKPAKRLRGHRNIGRSKYDPVECRKRGNW